MGNFVPYYYRPFDVRWIYWEPETKLLDEKRPDYFPQVFDGNSWLVSQQKPRREWSRPQLIHSIGCLDLMDRGATCIPMLLKNQAEEQASLFETEEKGYSVPNLSDSAQQYLSVLNLSVNKLFHHVVAVLHTLAYSRENSGPLRQDWPRIPLPATRDALESSAALGKQIAALLDTEQPVTGVTAGNVRAELQPVGNISRVDGGPLQPSEMSITAGWGHRGQNGVVMPGRGKLVERDYTSEELAAIQTGAEQLGLSLAQALAQLGDRTGDVYLNDVAYWRNVPSGVWEYVIGGYQVMKKWLSYREQEILRRAMTKEEVREVRDMARRIAAILLLQPALDANYKAVQEHTFPWPSPSG